LRDFKKTINEIKKLDDKDSKNLIRNIAFELRDLFVFINSESQKNNDEKAQIIEK
jgi:succinate dehydrogenase flavin-adding protein (antitoxin of CptAB toxin-antitoxin module)